jgi:hypothetical protein
VSKFNDKPSEYFDWQFQISNLLMQNIMELWSGLINDILKKQLNIQKPSVARCMSLIRFMLNYPEKSEQVNLSKTSVV